jgi:hypothetical protein
MSNIPEILKTGSLSTTTAGQTYTEVLEPVTFNSNSGCRFTLKAEGILNHSSKLVLGIDTNASVTRALFPPNVGIGSLIKRATLKVGGKTICETDDWNHLHAMKSVFITSQNNKEREVYMSSRCMNHEFAYKTSNASSASNSDSEASKYTLSYGQYPSMDGLVQETLVKTFQLVSNKPTFMIDMRDLFPFFAAGHQFPTYLVTESIHVDLTFEQDPFRVVCNASETHFGKSFNILQSECKLLQDIIVYDGEIMEQLRQSNNNIAFTYLDYQLTKTAVTQAQARDIQRNLGGAGRMVQNVLWCLTDEGSASTISDASLLNKYRAIAPATTGTFTSNIKYNDEFLYPLDQVNFGKHFHNLMHAEGGIPYVTRAEYGNQSGGLADAALAKFEKHDPQDNLAENFFYCGANLNKGERVNSVGLQLIAKYEDTPAFVGTGTLRAWIGVLKTVTISNGVTEVEFE